MTEKEESELGEELSKKFEKIEQYNRISEDLTALKSKKVSDKKSVKIRFNTNYPKTSDKKWRVLVEDKQTLVDAVRIYGTCWTSQDFVKGDDGIVIEKFHISCDAYSIMFDGDKLATINA